MISAPLFYGFAVFVVFFSLMVLMSSNPIISALSLATSMLGLAGIFFALGAHFIAAVQVTVYAGAVMVLFVIVLMLFDIKKEETSESYMRFLKIAVVGTVLGLLSGTITLSGFDSTTQVFVQDPASITPTKKIATLLFDKYLFAFEVLGVLLLVIAIGVVSVSRIKGGTHAKS